MAHAARPWESPAWSQLRAHADAGVPPLTQLLPDAERARRLTRGFAGTVLDVSRSRVTGETMDLLLRLVDEAGVRGKVQRMVAGDAVTNGTEHRAVLHTALRCAPDSKRFAVRFLLAVCPRS